MKIKYPQGATPLDLDELAMLIPNIGTQTQLDEFEAQNVAKAETWAQNNSRLCRELLSAGGLLRLHKRMFGDTWKWAGRFRNSDKNIGIAWTGIAQAVGILCGDANYWIANQTYHWPELAVRFHHRLVKIHPFVNGNGRHARLAASLLLECNGKPRLPWGGESLIEESAKRAEYIAALKDVDNGRLERLIRFGESGA